MTVSPTLLTSGFDGTDRASFTTDVISPVGNSLILVAVDSESASDPIACSLAGCGITWVLVNDVQWATLAAPTRRTALFRGMVASPSSGALTFTFSTTMQGSNWVVVQFSGMDVGGANGSGAIVQSVTNVLDTAGTSLTATLGAFTSSTNAVFAVFNKNDVNGFTPGAGFTELADISHTTPSVGMAAEFRNSADTSVDMTWGSSIRAAAIAVEIKEATSSTPNFPKLFGARPFVPLLGEAQTESVNKSANAGSAAERQKMALWWKHLHSDSSNQWPMGNGTKANASDLTFAARLAALGVDTSNYRNGSYVSQATSTQINFGEGSLLEAASPLAINVYWPGNYGGPRDSASTTRHTLVSSVNASAQSIDVFTVVGGSNNAPSATGNATQDPPYVPNSWPYWPTKSTLSTSTSTAVCLSWIRIENEIMRVNTVTFNSGTGTVTLGVTRGLFGTGGASHTAGTKVFSPVYISPTSADDLSLAGAPWVDNSNAAIRYGIRIWTAAGADFIGDRIEATFLINDATNPWQGHSAIWYDVSGPNMYANADAWAHTVFGWNDRGLATIDAAAATKFTTNAWGLAQFDKFTLLGARAGWSGKHFYANGAGQNWGSWKAANLTSVVQGGISEQYLPTSAGITDSDVQFTFESMAGNYNSIMWIRPNRSPAEPDIDKHLRYSYGLLLLAYRSSAVRFQFGGRSLADPLFGGGTAKAPPDLLFWNWGAPAADPADVNDAILSTATSTLKKRTYANGIVLVNFGTSGATYSLGGNYYDVNDPDVNGDPSIVSGNVTVPAKDSMFLLSESAVLSQTPSLSGSGIDVNVEVGTGSIAVDSNPSLGGHGIDVAVELGTGALSVGPGQALVGTGVTVNVEIGVGEVVNPPADTEGGDQDAEHGQQIRDPGDPADHRHQGRIIRS